MEPYEEEDGVRPFSNGTQYLDWEASNCGRCVKRASQGQVGLGVPLPCDLEEWLGTACISSGLIPPEIARRIGYTPDRYVWPCTEVVWTEAWKKEHDARKER